MLFSPWVWLRDRRTWAIADRRSSYKSLCLLSSGHFSLEIRILVRLKTSKPLWPKFFPSLKLSPNFCNFWVWAAFGVAVCALSFSGCELVSEPCRRNTYMEDTNNTQTGPNRGNKMFFARSEKPRIMFGQEGEKWRRRNRKKKKTNNK